MIKVLQIYPQMNNAGTEKVIMNLYKNINQEKVHFDFLVNKKGLLDEEIKKSGAKIFYLEHKNKKQYYDSLIKFFIDNKYEIIHVHTQGDMEIVLKAAKKSNVKCRIIHSHTARQDVPKILKILRLYRNLQIEKNATDFFACSTDAAKWLFPHKYKETKIVYNAINIQDFLFDENKRNEVRKNFKIEENAKVIINVARISKGKNQFKIINLMKKIKKLDNKVKVILVGTGDLQEKIKKEIRKENLEDNFLLLGNRNDVNELLMASDLFLFPTLYEGLGIAVVEAQFSGLKCITSERVPAEADIGTGLLKMINLSTGDKIWIKEIEEALSLKYDRNCINKAYNNKFDIKIIAKDIENFYLSKAN